MDGTRKYPDIEVDKRVCGQFKRRRAVLSTLANFIFISLGRPT